MDMFCKTDFDAFIHQSWQQHDVKPEQLKLYQFTTHAARHYFCSECGIYTHHQRRSDPGEFSYHLGCLEGINPYLLVDVPVMDGVNHPSERPPAGG